jgi:hypothetical protein
MRLVTPEDEAKVAELSMVALTPALTGPPNTAFARRRSNVAPGQ